VFLTFFHVVSMIILLRNLNEHVRQRICDFSSTVLFVTVYCLACGFYISLVVFLFQVFNFFF